MKSEKRGFTLIELLVVIAIIGLLASIVLASLNTARKKGRDARRVADLKQLQNALELYANDFGGAYPDGATQGPVSVRLTPLVPNYIAALPSDPLNAGNNVYNYKTNGTAPFTGYCIGSLVEGSPPTPSSTCSGAAAITLTATLNYAVGN